MKRSVLTKLFLILGVFITSNALAKTIEVSSQTEFVKAHSRAVAKDVILWLPGTYQDIDLKIVKDNITVRAKFLGKTIFTGASKALIRGDYITFSGFQYLAGDIGGGDVIKLGGNHITVSEINIVRYRSFKYLSMKRECQYNTVYKCNFENRLNIVDKNILSITVSKEHPGFHKVQYCSFRNIVGTGRDMGVEPIRIGTSYNAEFDSKSIVEYCYFTNCNGDGELISNKAGKNILRYNTFEKNPLAELVLRHGNDSYVYGNFFIKGKGGIRIREGQNHYIYNNYFTELTGRSISIHSGNKNPIKNVYIMHNTFVKTARLHLGGSRKILPKKVVLANNLFAYPNTTSIANVAGKEIWLGNMFEGKLGVSPNKGLKKIKPLWTENEFGYYELANNSPAVNSAKKNKVKLPIVKGFNADNKLAYDIVKNKRPDLFSQKDVGCFEFNSSKAIVLKPFATSENSGPSYDISTVLEGEAEKEAEKRKEEEAIEKEYGKVEYEEVVVKENAKPKKVQQIEAKEEMPNQKKN